MDGRGATAAAAVLGVLLLAGCAAPAAAPSGTAAAAGTSPAGSSDASMDACALVPRALLEAAVGADPGEGRPSAGTLGGGRCTWRISGTHTATLQVTPQPDAFLPASAWRRPRSAADVLGVDRGWAAAETHTVLLVRHGRGVLLTEVGFRRADQRAYDALAEAIAARM